MIELLAPFSSADLFEYNLSQNKKELVSRLNIELSRFKTQEEAAAFIGTKQPRVSDLKQFKIDKFSLELILEYLSKFEINLKIKNVEGKVFIGVE